MNSSNTWAQDKERLREILSGDEFARQQDAGGRNWLESVIDNILDWIRRLFLHTDIPQGTSSVVSTAVLITAIIGFLVLIFWLTRRMAREHKHKGAVFTHGEKIRSQSDYLLEAKNRAESGEWREASRVLFLALLVYMQKKSWVRVEQWKTNWEYMEEIQYNHPEARELFHRHARTFEQVWYGGTKVDESLFWGMWKELDSMRREEGQQHG